MINGISFQQAMKIIDMVDENGNAYPFDISFRTLQRNSKTGGRLVTYLQVKKARSKNKTQTIKSLLHAAQSSRVTTKNPNHYNNRTRNLELQNGEKRKIHIRLIDTINGKKMHY